MEPVEIVTIAELIPISKNGEPANAIEVARIKNSEGNVLQFNIIVGKGLYKIGDEVVYIMPDYCIPNTELFRDYYEPFGNPKKSKLGKKGRIRAVKFNFQFEGESDPIYSNGIMIPLKLMDEKIHAVDFDETLQECLQVIKYVADDTSGQPKGLTKGDRPYFLYGTDETRIEELKDHVNSLGDEALSFTLKRDGSSITLYCGNINDEHVHGVCSRMQEKKLDQQYTSAYKDGDYTLHPYYRKLTEEKGWYNDFTESFYTEEEVQQFEPIETEVRDAWVDTTKKHEYLEKLIKYCEINDLGLALRGELIGSGNKGSGNKLNKDKEGDSRVVWFGVDDLSSGVAVRNHYGQEFHLQRVCEDLEIECTKELFVGKFNYDDIIRVCNEYFKEIKKETGQIVEGIVIRSKFSNRLSTKYINPEYDAKA